MKVHRIIFTVFTILSLGLGGCALDKPRLPVQPEEGLGETPRVLVDAYRMAVGDVLRVIVWKNPDLSISVSIRPDGKITVPLVGDVVAVGKTPEEMASLIKEKLVTYIKNPNVTVVLTSMPGQEYLSKIRVLGSVSNSSSLTYNQGMTVLDAVMEAGGLDLYADGNRTKLHRRTAAGKGRETYDIRMDDIMEDGDMTTNIILQPGDIIVVPESGF